MNDFYNELTRYDMAEYGIEFFHQTTKPLATAARSHVHGAIELLLITDGDFTVLCDGKEAVARVGELVLFRSNCVHTVRAGEGKKNAYYVFKIDPTLIFSLCPEKNAEKYALSLSIFSEKSKFVWRAEELLGTEIISGFERLRTEKIKGLSTRDIAMRAAAFSIISELLCQLEENGTGDDALPPTVYSLIYKSMKYVNEHFTEDVSAESMALLLNISYSYFSRSFTKVTGKSFRKYLNLVRIRKAEQLLLTSEKNVTEIAFSVGYNNVSHFIATYRKIKGQTPHKQKRGDVSEGTR